MFHQSSNRFGMNFLSLSSSFSDFITTYMPLGFPSFLPSFLPSSPASFLSFRYSFLRLFPSDALFSFILLSTFLSFSLPTQLFPILPRFLSRAAKQIKLHLYEPRDQTQRLKTTTHCVSQQGNQTESLRDHNYG